MLFWTLFAVGAIMLVLFYAVLLAHQRYAFDWDAAVARNGVMVVVVVLQRYTGFGGSTCFAPPLARPHRLWLATARWHRGCAVLARCAGWDAEKERETPNFLMEELLMVNNSGGGFNPPRPFASSHTASTMPSYQCRTLVGW